MTPQEDSQHKLEDRAFGKFKKPGNANHPIGPHPPLPNVHSRRHVRDVPIDTNYRKTLLAVPLKTAIADPGAMAFCGKRSQETTPHAMLFEQPTAERVLRARVHDIRGLAGGGEGQFLASFTGGKVLLVDVRRHVNCWSILSTHSRHTCTETPLLTNDALTPILRSDPNPPQSTHLHGNSTND